VVTGVSMPRLDGIGLCRLLREHGADVPVLFLASRRSSGGERLRCFMVGGDEIVAKPFEPKELAGRVVEILRTRPPGSATWPTINLKKARSRLGPRRIEPNQLEAHISLGAKHAREGNVGLYLVGYEFRFVDGNEGSAFVDRFFEGLGEQIRAEDALCPMSGPRIVVVLVDADEDVVRSVLDRIHERMVVEAAASLAGRRRVKPKALYRLLALSPPTLGCEAADARFVETLFAQPARLIEEDLQGRPGEPVEKYPLLESVYAALSRGDSHCASPRDGTNHELTIDPKTGVRSVVIGEYRYRTQDPNEESPAGARAGRGAQLVWVEEGSDLRAPIARIEDGRVFRDDDV
ncbi:MAG: response regulator, partial [Myxococcota bacterium]